MKLDHGTINAATVSASRRAVDFFELTKPRIVLMVLITAFVGYYAGSGRIPDYLQLLQMLIGTALAAGGTLTLNQFIERERSTRKWSARAGAHCPTAVCSPRRALVRCFVDPFGPRLSCGGRQFTERCCRGRHYLELSLDLYADEARQFALCASRRDSRRLAARDRLVLPRRRAVCRRVGAVCDMFLWQIPHTLAIAYLYREDFARPEFSFCR